MSAFDLVMLVIMGDLVQQGVTQQDNSLTAAFLAVGTIAILIVTVSYLSYRFQRASTVTDGLPVVVVRDGKILRQIVSIERLTEDEIKEEARQQGIGDLGEVLVGVLETDGTFSFVTGERRREQAGSEPPVT